MPKLLSSCLLLLAIPTGWADPAPIADDATHYENRSEYRAPRARARMTVDGLANEGVWQRAPWHDIPYRWLGPEYSPADFDGRFKVAWSTRRIYMLAEIVDDVLFDSHRDPLEQYWDDDCLEIFVDEDHSGGEHQYNHNAFAYHLSLDNKAIDLGTDRKPRDYSHHVESRWQQRGDKVIWEVGIDIYSDEYLDDSPDNKPVKLSTGKVMGLMVAYCDNDGSALRELFVGSESVPGEDKNRGWKDAGLFGTLILADSP